jgi:hypothetical protein
MFGHQDDHQDDHGQQHDEAQHEEHQTNPALPTDLSGFGAPADDHTVDSADNVGIPSEPGEHVEPDAPAPAHDDLLAPSNANDLLDIKQRALQQLSPLVDHLDQTPEEKFRTTMMMIQASDDQNLIKAAYEAAKQIDDEKAKAQALLDIVNEINYFTHQNNSGEA